MTTKSYEEYKTKRNAELLANVQRSMAKLEPHHFSWIIDAAAKEFDKRLKKTEHDIVRHTTMNSLSEPYLDRDFQYDGGKTRVGTLEQNRETLRRYQAIVLFLNDLHAYANELDAQRFAENVRITFGTPIKK